MTVFSFDIFTATHDQIKGGDIHATHHRVVVMADSRNDALSTACLMACASDSDQVPTLALDRV